MRLQGALVLASIAFGSTLCVGASAATRDYAPTSVCTIAAQHDGRYPRSVMIDADLFNGMPHGVFLGDLKCPRRGIQIDIGHDPGTADPSAATLDNYISRFSGFGGLIGHGRFCGSIKRDQTTGRIYLLIQRVFDFEPRGLPAWQLKGPPTVTLPQGPR